MELAEIIGYIDPSLKAAEPFTAPDRGGMTAFPDVEFTQPPRQVS